MHFEDPRYLLEVFFSMLRVKNRAWSSMRGDRGWDRGWGVNKMGWDLKYKICHHLLVLCWEGAAGGALAAGRVRINICTFILDLTTIYATSLFLKLSYYTLLCCFRCWNFLLKNILKPRSSVFWVIFYLASQLNHLSTCWADWETSLDQVKPVNWFKAGGS